jgi:hypothetical protein
MEYADQLRKNLQKLVDSGVYSVIELAGHAGVTRATIYDFLHSRLKDLGSSKVMSLAKGLDLTVEELMEKEVRIPAKSA